MAVLGVIGHILLFILKIVLVLLLIALALVLLVLFLLNTWEAAARGDRDHPVDVLARARLRMFAGILKLQLKLQDGILQYRILLMGHRLKGGETRLFHSQEPEADEEPRKEPEEQSSDSKDSNQKEKASKSDARRMQNVNQAEDIRTADAVAAKKSRKQDTPAAPDDSHERADITDLTVDAKPGTDLKPKADAEQATDAKLKADDAKLGADGKPGADAKPETDVKPATDAKPETGAKPEIDVKSATDAKPEIDAKPENEAEPNMNSDEHGSHQSRARKKSLFCHRSKARAENRRSSGSSGRESILSILRDPENRGALSLLKKQLLRVLRHIAPKQLKLHGEIGTGDPALTAWIIGGIYLFYPAYADLGDITVQGEMNESALRGKFYGKGRFFLIVPASAAVRLLLSKEVRQLIRKLRSR